MKKIDIATAVTTIAAVILAAIGIVAVVSPEIRAELINFAMEFIREVQGT